MIVLAAIAAVVAVCLAAFGRPGQSSAGSPPRRRALAGAQLAVAALLVAGWFVALRPASLGGPATYVVVRGTSMLPKYEGLDLVIVRARSTYAVGDVVAFEVPEGEPGAGDVVIHRITGGDEQAGYVTKGDNNTDRDPAVVPASAVVGTPALHVPRLGAWLAWTSTPLGLASVAAGIAVVAYRPWRPAPPLRPQQAPA